MHSIAGKVVAALYAIVGTLAFASAIGEIASIPIKRRQRRKEAAVGADARPPSVHPARQGRALAVAARCDQAAHGAGFPPTTRLIATALPR